MVRIYTRDSNISERILAPNLMKSRSQNIIREGNRLFLKRGNRVSVGEWRAIERGKDRIRFDCLPRTYLT